MGSGVGRTRYLGRERRYSHPTSQGSRLTGALKAVGATGLAAYFSMIDTGRVKAGDFVVVSDAAGATGSIA